MRRFLKLPRRSKPSHKTAGSSGSGDGTEPIPSESSSSHHPPDELCTDCVYLDWRDIVPSPPSKRPETINVHNSWLEWSRLPNKWSRKVEQYQKSLHCPVCQLIAHILDLESSDLGKPLMPLWDVRPVRVEIGSTPAERYWRMHFYIPELHEGPSNQPNILFDHPPSFTKRGIQYMAQRTSHFGEARLPILHGRDVDINDLDMLKWWMEHCKEAHRLCRMPSNVSIPSLTNVQTRLIDCGLRCVVQKQLSGTHYAALSYVWGQVEQLKLTNDTIKELMATGALVDDNPKLRRTILNAIQLCDKLGFQYLWVDALCIQQDDLVDQAAQIEAMGTIYRGAALTIVGAAGQDADSGLPGIGTTPRVCGQMVKTVKYVYLQYDDPERYMLQNVRFATTLLSFWDALGQSTWVERGWTFQEAMLSPFQLIFTKDQVFWSCLQQTYMEDIYLESEYEVVEAHTQCTAVHHIPGRVETSTGTFSLGQPYSRHPPTVSMELRQSVWFGKESWQLYFDAVDKYSSRHLGFQSDAENAIKGFLQILNESEAFQETQFLFALPVVALDYMLNWYNHPGSERRPGFPSWSWLGWQGPIKYELQPGVNPDPLLRYDSSLVCGDDQKSISTLNDILLQELKACKEVEGHLYRRFEERFALCLDEPGPLFGNEDLGGISKVKMQLMQEFSEIWGTQETPEEWKKDPVLSSEEVVEEVLAKLEATKPVESLRLPDGSKAQNHQSIRDGPSILQFWTSYARLEVSNGFGSDRTVRLLRPRRYIEAVSALYDIAERAERHGLPSFNLYRVRSPLWDVGFITWITVDEQWRQLQGKELDFIVIAFRKPRASQASEHGSMTHVMNGWPISVHPDYSQLSEIPLLLLKLMCVEFIDGIAYRRGVTTGWITSHEWLLAAPSTRWVRLG